ncbi:Hypothetical protein NTJ_01276 [Nesidiocoris tenuis]|uniref:Uncharacterized protein n=1 Tax=Nesidiocoris tenuis TaxID=355587 RepID=A0ABN7ACB5_9HEMI|nr:Hypothetical protein NTJ_01276 [Nesidiocoris tenuis]
MKQKITKIRRVRKGFFSSFIRWRSIRCLARERRKTRTQKRLGPTLGNFLDGHPSHSAVLDSARQPSGEWPRIRRFEPRSLVALNVDNPVLRPFRQQGQNSRTADSQSSRRTRFNPPNLYQLLLQLCSSAVLASVEMNFRSWNCLKRNEKLILTR